MNRNLIVTATAFALILAGVTVVIWRDKTPQLIVEVDSAPLYEIVGKLGHWGPMPHNVVLRIPKGTQLQAIWTYDVKHYLIYHVRFDGKDGYLIIGDVVPIK